MEFVIKTREGAYVAGFVGVPPHLKLTAQLKAAERYRNRWAALEACSRGGATLHMAAIVPYSPQNAPAGSAGRGEPKKRQERA